MGAQPPGALDQPREKRQTKQAVYRNIFQSSPSLTRSLNINVSGKQGKNLIRQWTARIDDEFSVALSAMGSRAYSFRIALEIAGARLRGIVG